MPTIVFSENWDVALNGTDSFNASRVTTPTFAGAGAMRIQTTLQVGYWDNTISQGAQAVVVMQAYIRFTTLPAENIRLLGCDLVSGGGYGIWIDPVTGKFVCVSQGVLGTPGGPVVVTGTWYKLDVRVDARANPSLVDGRVDGVALPQSSLSEAATTTDAYKVGDGGRSPTWDAYFDELRASHIAADFPITDSIATVAWLTA